MEYLWKYQTRNLLFEHYIADNGLTYFSKVSRLDGEPVGSIMWHTDWRKYVFCPQHEESLIDVQMMDDIILQINSLSDEHEVN